MTLRQQWAADRSKHVTTMNELQEVLELVVPPARIECYDISHTQGKQTVFVTHAGRVFEFLPPTVSDVVNPIGCGDCMAAAIAWSLEEGNQVLEAIRCGMAAAADNLSQLWPARLDKREIDRLRQEIRVP